MDIESSVLNWYDFTVKHTCNILETLISDLGNVRKNKLWFWIQSKYYRAESFNWKSPQGMPSWKYNQLQLLLNVIHFKNFYNCISYCVFFDSLLNQKPNQPCSKVEKQLSPRLQKLLLFTHQQTQHWLRGNKNFTSRLVLHTF